MSADEGEGKVARKRAKITHPHECTVILLDVGSGMESRVNGMPSMELARETVEWVLTRKVL